MKIVGIGGGHGLSQMACYLNPYEGTDQTYVVTPYDSGGSTGKLREEGILGAGDFTRVCNALSGSDRRLKEIRDQRCGEGHSVRNLEFADMWLRVDPEYAMRELQRRYQLNGDRRVYLSSLDDCHLVANLENGDKLEREHEIDLRGPSNGNRIRGLYLSNRSRVYPPLIQHVLYADLIFVGPGSLYTSILPHFLIEDFPELIEASEGEKIYICNVAEEPGSTDGFGVDEHVERLLEVGFEPDFVLVDDTRRYNGGIRDAYGKEGKGLIDPVDKLRSSDAEIIVGDLTDVDGTSILHGEETVRGILRLGGYDLSH